MHDPKQQGIITGWIARSEVTSLFRSNFAVTTIYSGAGAFRNTVKY